MKSFTIYYPDEAGKFLSPERLIQFWMRVDVQGPNDCWLWKGSDSAAGSGYGQYRVDGKLMLTHRIAKRDVTGDPGVGRVLRHNCRTPLCCNPDHLQYGTQKDNIQDSIKDRTFRTVDGKLGVAARQAKRASAAK